MLRIRQVVFGALSGGVASELSGGDFWQGAITGGIVAGLNHAIHQIVSPFADDDELTQKQHKQQHTKELLLKKKLPKIKINQRISGDDLKKIIPDLKGVDYIERVSATKFNIKPTFLGRTLMSNGAYLEIRPNSSIQGIGSNNKQFMTKGVYIKVVHKLTKNEINRNNSDFINI